MMNNCTFWSNTGVQWVNSNWTWSECQLIEEIIQSGGVDATTLLPSWVEEPWDPYRAGEEEKKKRKRIIKLICKVKDIKYDEEKMTKDFKITVDDVKMIVKAVSGIDLKIK